MRSGNLHGTALVVADRGILIVGASGTGKSTLALSLVRTARMAGLFGRVVSDDQFFADVAGGRLVCSAPETIAGLAEVHGLGPVAMPHERRVLIDLVVRLVAAAKAERYRNDTHEKVMGLAIPSLVLAQRNTTSAVTAILAQLGLAAVG